MQELVPETVNTEVKKLKPVETKIDPKEASKKARMIERDKDREKVRGIFRFHEVPGGSMSFVFKKHEGDQVERYDMVDGEVYTVPLGVAKHLNKNCAYPIHAFLKDENGKNVARASQKVRRCSFSSLEFIDTADLKPDGGIISVESSGF